MVPAVLCILNISLYTSVKNKTSYKIDKAANKISSLHCNNAVQTRCSTHEVYEHVREY